MASIISSKRGKDHIILSLKLDLNEVAELKGSMDNIHLIPEENVNAISTIYERGKDGITKYFLIPKCLRKDVKLKKEVGCLRIDTKSKLIWIYIMDKLE